MTQEPIACAIETSTQIGSVGLSDGRGGRLCATFEEGMRHGREVVPALERLLAEAGRTIDELRLVVCGVGPGSYTGLRIGVVAGRSLAWALGCEIMAVASHDAIARAARRQPAVEEIVTFSDARRRAFYFARYSQDPLGRPTGGHQLGTWEEFLAQVPAGTELAGPGLGKHGEPLQQAGYRLAPRALWHPAAADLLALGLERSGAGERAGLAEVAPIYLRDSVPGWPGARGAS